MNIPLCKHCGQPVRQQANYIARAQREGKPLYCDRKCAGLARRRKEPLTPEQLKARKADYDRQRRIKLADRIKAEKAAYFQRTYDREKARIERKAKAHLHAEYCRRPEYRAWKSEYDRRLRARKQFGDDFAESFLLLQDIEKEIDARATRYEIYLSNGTINKAQTRKRALL